MTAISGTVTFRTTVTIVAASSGDGDTIAAMFNGVIIPQVNTATAATATNASGTVTLYWPQTTTRGGNQWVHNVVATMIAAVTTLTSPITTTVATALAMTS
jgi:hypothetical protein